jgi:hypothetical protein
MRRDTKKDLWSQQSGGNIPLEDVSDQEYALMERRKGFRMPEKTLKALGAAKKSPPFALKSLKVADAKGRVLLGTRVAKQPVQVEERGPGEWTIRLVEVVPIKEAWLFKNPEALRRVQQGVQQAQKREFATDPRKGLDSAWLTDVDEEHV